MKIFISFFFFFLKVIFVDAVGVYTERSEIPGPMRFIANLLLVKDLAKGIEKKAFSR